MSNSNINNYFTVIETFLKLHFQARSTQLHFMNLPSRVIDTGARSVIASVSESKDNIFSANHLPIPPLFRFKDKNGRVNWDKIQATDISQLTAQVEIQVLQDLLTNLTFSKLDRSDLERMGDSHFGKLFRLAQQTVEYLIYTQNYLATLTESLDLNYK